MNSLTAKELYHLNNVTAKMDLGDKVQEIIDQAKLINVGSAPVNGVAATKTLTISGVVVHGETVVIHNPDVAFPDTYEFLADAAQVPSAAHYIAVDIEANTAKSTGTLTLAVQPTAGDTMTIGTKGYTFVPVGTANADGEISVGVDLPAAKLAVVAAVNGLDGYNQPNSLASIAAFVANNAVVTALIGGVLGDAIATTETFANVGNLFAAATLGGGADCVQANAVTALVAANVAGDTNGVSFADGAGDTVVVTALMAGVAGNDFLIGETMAHGAFAGGAVLLSGGVDGTVGFAHELRSDGTYLYVCTAANSISDANWRRIALGNVY